MSIGRAGNGSRKPEAVRRKKVSKNVLGESAVSSTGLLTMHGTALCVDFPSLKGIEQVGWAPPGAGVTYPSAAALCETRYRARAFLPLGI